MTKQEMVTKYARVGDKVLVVKGFTNVISYTNREMHLQSWTARGNLNVWKATHPLLTPVFEIKEQEIIEFVFTRGDKVMLSHDGGKTWTEIIWGYRVVDSNLHLVRPKRKEDAILVGVSVAGQALLLNDKERKQLCQFAAALIADRNK